MPRRHILSRLPLLIAGLLFGIVFPAFAQIGPELQMAELSKKLQLTDQQKQELSPIMEERDKQIKALKADTSMGKLQKLHKAMALQANFKDQAAKYLNPEQVKKLETLQAERRARLTAH
jgi:Spy/CpxP family protein refolding chaperone